MARQEDGNEAQATLPAHGASDEIHRGQPMQHGSHRPAGILGDVGKTTGEMHVGSPISWGWVGKGHVAS